MIRRAILVGLALAGLTACAHKPADAPRGAYRELPVAVAVGCVRDRPAPPPRLLDAYTDAEWEALAPGAMAYAFLAQAGERLNYTDRLEAATKGCREGR